VKGILATSDTTWEDFERLEREKAAEEKDKKVKVAKPLDAKANDRRGTGLKQ